MSLRSPTSNEIALTLALSHRNGRGDFLIQDVPDVNPRPLAGEGRVRVLCPLSVFSKEREGHEDQTNWVSILRACVMRAECRVISMTSYRRSKRFANGENLDDGGTKDWKG